MLTFDRGLTPEQVGRIHLDAARRWLGYCRRCDLARTRRNVVYGAGSVAAPVMLVGLAPNYFEDREGHPFAGQAGQVLADAAAAVGLVPTRDLYATTLLKCILPYAEIKEGEERRRIDPPPECWEACRPAFLKQLEVVRPAILVVHGRGANRLLFRDPRPLVHYAGHWRRVSQTCVALSTHSPAGLTGEREYLQSEYRYHWGQLALRLNLLGRKWRPDAECFQAGWGVS